MMNQASRAPLDRGEASGEGSQANAPGEADEGRGYAVADASRFSRTAA